ncbi:hypothetical protein H8E50_08455, partial [bacterium]|nr:hypothetical protein [bacterium]
MIKLLDKLKKYLLDVLDCPVSTVKWEEANQLPLFLRDGYEYYRISVLNSSYLLMIAADNKEQQPAMVRKHLFKVKEKSAYDVIYMKETVTSYNRKRLIENKVPFIIPGNQMYLPMLGIDLREHFRKQQEETISFSPSTQAVVLYAIYHREVEVFTPGHLTKHLGYTAMTMTRVFDELQQAGIGEHSVNGRERFIHFNHKGRKFW